jgi:hypothetical protein
MRIYVPVVVLFFRIRNNENIEEARINVLTTREMILLFILEAINPSLSTISKLATAINAVSASITIRLTAIIVKERG